LPKDLLLRIARLPRSLAVLVLLVFMLVSMEWLFHVTKPSFLGILPYSSQLEALVGGFALAFLIALVLHVPTILISCAGSRKSRNRVIFLQYLVPALVATLCVFLVLDNFTYTVFSIGVIKSETFGKLAYMALLLVFFILVLRKLSNLDRAEFPPWIKIGSALIIALAALFCVVKTIHGSGISPPTGESVRSGENLPNIVLFAIDGVEAQYLSAYGYPQETSPHLDEFLDRSTVFDNALSNASGSTASTTSMLTGKHPHQTKVVSAAHPLTGIDAYEHLPGLLRGYGYFTFQETIRYYADGPELNLRNGFHFANGRAVSRAWTAILPARIQSALASGLQLLEAITRRVSQRMLHIFFIEPMQNVYAVLQSGRDASFAQREATSDAERIDRAITVLESIDEPFFAHIQLFESTHCTWREGHCEFGYGNQTGGAHHSEPGYFDEAFPEALRQGDIQFGRFMEWLEQTSRLQNTLVIFHSDHAIGWEVNRRIPLIVIEPGRNQTRRVSETAQLLDIAPTVLDYIGVDVPTWMSGVPLLSTEKLDPMRIHLGYRSHSQVNAGPPHYNLWHFFATVCQRIYRLEVANGTVENSQLPGHTRPCAGEFPNNDTIRDQLYRELERNNYLFQPMDGSLE
jgi:hypothetical protein